MGGYLRDSRYDKVLDLMYPQLVEAGGGRDKMLRGFKEIMGKMTQDGFKFEAVEIGQPTEPVAGGSQLFAVVPQTVRVSSPKIKIESASYLLAISGDQGKSWTFLDGSGITPAAISQFFPEFPASLKLPDKQPPKITKLP